VSMVESELKGDVVLEVTEQLMSKDFYTPEEEENVEDFY